MKILFLTHRVPEPPDRGDKIRAHHIARRLAGSHELHVACLLDAADEVEHARTAGHWAASVTYRIRRQTESVLRATLAPISRRPMTTGFFRSGALAAEVRRLITHKRFDVVLAYCSSMAQYAQGFEGAKVLDLVDVDSEKWKQYADRSSFPKRIVYRLEHRLLRTYEQALLQEFDRCILVSETERKILSPHDDEAKTKVIALGVDADRWKRPWPRAWDPVLVFTGVLDYFANVDGIVFFARQVFPKIQSLVPRATLRIVGRRPISEVRSLDAMEGVTVVGEVEDIRPELWSAAVAIAPLRIAQGTQTKVLEAMASETPVVATSAVARGIAARPHEHLLLGDTPEELAAACARLLTSRADGDSLAERAREYVVAEHSWDQKAHEYEVALQRALESRRRSDISGIEDARQSS